MAESDAFGKRERALEDEFFHRMDKALLEKMRESAEREQSREALAAATGIEDRALLDKLVDRGVQATTMVAMTVIPPVFVAWADGNVTPEEREAILRAARENGIADQGIAHQLLDDWLQHAPPSPLWETWQHYVRGVLESLDDVSQQSLRSSIMKQSKSVAKASGGVLGIGKTSASEQRVLDDIERTLASS